MSNSWQSALQTRRHPNSRDGRRYVTCDLELWPIKNSFCVFLAGVKTYTHTKN